MMMAVPLQYLFAAPQHGLYVMIAFSYRESLIQVLVLFVKCSSRLVRTLNGGIATALAFWVIQIKMSTAVTQSPWPNIYHTAAIARIGVSGRLC